MKKKLRSLCTVAWRGLLVASSFIFGGGSPDTSYVNRGVLAVLVIERQHGITLDALGSISAKVMRIICVLTERGLARGAMRVAASIPEKPIEQVEAATT
jgi:hypothetical protein